MSVQEINDPELLSHVGNHKQVILKYHSELCGEECKEIIAMFQRLSNETEYQDIVFLRINSENNPTAKQFLEGKKTCIVSIYSKGRLLDSCYATTRVQIQELLERLKAG
jgi:thioredoxin 1